MKLLILLIALSCFSCTHSQKNNEQSNEETITTNEITENQTEVNSEPEPTLEIDSVMADFDKNGILDTVYLYRRGHDNSKIIAYPENSELSQFLNYQSRSDWQFIDNIGLFENEPTMFYIDQETSEKIIIDNSQRLPCLVLSATEENIGTIHVSLKS